jgi:WhiB family redox-sensing transcriptional regulator
VKLVRAFPNTLEAPGQWVQRAACITEGDAMFPDNNAAGIAYAKSICNRCPVIGECRERALDERIPFGVWGGMSEKERSNLLRQAARRNLTPAAVKAQAEQARQAAKPRTLQSIFDDSTTRLDGGHLGWTGPKKVHFGGQVYTPKQVCFTLDRGHHPDGQVTSDCGITACVLPRHLLDTGERTRWTAAAKASA